MFSDSNLR